VETNKARRKREHRQNVALLDLEEATQRTLRREKHEREERERDAKRQRWEDNRGEAAEQVPRLPKELWATIHQIGRQEQDQLDAWVAWADAKLMQLVVVWFRTGGQRDSQWLGKLVGPRGGPSVADTTNIALRFTPWCRSILQPGAENEPLHYGGRSNAPANFVNVYVHMLAMMNYLGFHNVIARLQRIMRLLMRCIHPDSGVPKYIPGPPDSDDEEDDWDDDVPEPGQQPPCPQKAFTDRSRNIAM
jgi:hypothetical protein